MLGGIHTDTVLIFTVKYGIAVLVNRSSISGGHCKKWTYICRMARARRKMRRSPEEDEEGHAYSI